ncbi:MAG TPA: trigger factor [Polyangiaceae bacterium]
MQVNVQQLSPVLVEFQVEIPAERVKSEVDKAYQALQRTARVKGFRPGKAPRDILTHLFGERVTLDVTRRLVDDTLAKALSDKNIQPLSQPNVEPQKLSTGTNFSYKARFEVRPEIASVKYDGFEVKRPSIAVTEPMIEAELENLRKAHAIVSAPAEPRPARKGDAIEISFTIEVAGKKVPEASSDNVQVELGGGQFLPELEEAILGASPGEEKDVSLTFAANHARPDFRGKPALFHIKIKEVKERVLPDLDDDFAKDLGTFQTLTELKDDIRGKLEKIMKQRAEDAVAEQLVGKLVEANPIPCPPSLVEQQCQLMEQEIAQQARRSGEPVPRHEELHARVHADSEVKVRAGLLMAEIAKEAQIKVTDEDIEKGLTELAEQMGKQVAKLRVEYRDPKKREMLVGMIIEDKILDIIESKAKITEA